MCVCVVGKKTPLQENRTPQHGLNLLLICMHSYTHIPTHNCTCNWKLKIWLMRVFELRRMKSYNDPLITSILVEKLILCCVVTSFLLILIFLLFMYLFVTLSPIRAILWYKQVVRMNMQSIWCSPWNEKKKTNTNQNNTHKISQKRLVSGKNQWSLLSTVDSIISEPIYRSNPFEFELNEQTKKFLILCVQPSDSCESGRLELSMKVLRGKRNCKDYYTITA